MGKFRRKFSKFLVAALAASFLMQSEMILYASGVQEVAESTENPVDIVQMPTVEDSVKEENLEQGTTDEADSTEENETESFEETISQEATTEEKTVDQEESSTKETVNQEESSTEKGTTSQEESSVVEETASQEETSVVKENEIQKTTSSIEESSSAEAVIIEETEKVWFNTGKKEYCVVKKEDFDNELGDAYFKEDGSYTIQIPEENPFFPYEVQFTYEGEYINKWFLTPNDSVEIGGHTFYVSAYFDGTAITQMSFAIAGDTIVVYPEEKNFTNNGGLEPLSLLPIKEMEFYVDFSSYTPAELTMVSLDSIFVGEKELTNEDKVIFAYENTDDFIVVNYGDVMDFSYNTAYYNTNSYQMIITKADQLDVNNIRCMVNIDVKFSEEWLKPTVYIQDDTGRIGSYVLGSSYEDDNEENKENREFITRISGNTWKDTEQIYISLEINKDVFESPCYKDLKIYEGKYISATEAIAGIDITDKIYNADMIQIDAGYAIKRDGDNWITIVTFDGAGNATGCLPINLILRKSSNSINYQLFTKEENKDISVVSYRMSLYKDKCRYVTYTLKPGYPANETYYQKLYYYRNGVLNSSNVTAAYLGQYSSISAAKAAKAKEINVYLFGSEGYAADYSQGVYFTIFVGNDGEESQEIYQYYFKTENYKKTYSDETDVDFYGVRDKDGYYLSSYSLSEEQDSYSEFNYLTILVEEDVDLTRLAPEFSVYGGNLYAKGSSSPEISGESYHDFSSGAVQYTASAENGEDSKNYWLRILKPSDGAGQLYINSMEDSNSSTKIENGIIYSNREVYLDGYHSRWHDIILINIGTEEIPSLSVEIQSDIVELNEYWTLQGKNGLLGFNGIEKQSEYGELENLAKIRIQAKEGIKDGTEVSGKLIIKSNDKVIMELTLSGTVGDPCIITKELPPAVKYVPYGTMIQNSNKYSWNQISYSIQKGSLPEGMELRPNGELYGVPLQEGTFPITLKATNSSSKFNSSSAELVLVVNDNTNVNVYTASDEGYKIEEHIGTEAGAGTYDYILGTISDQLFVSSGQYIEFIDLWLNGEQLVDGEDYTKDSGSTRITIRSQTFEKKAKNGTNTIAAEFRVGGDENKELKRTAQNFRLNLKNNNNENDDSDDNNSSSSSGSSGSNSSSGSSSNNSSNGSSNTNSNQNKDVPSTTYNDDSWVKDATGWWCKTPSGSWLSNTWFQLPYKGTTGWYYFNEQGYMATGWLEKNGQWYYLNPISDGTQGMMCTGWKKINGRWCYFDKEGALVMNTWCQIPYMETTKWYYFDEQGYMAEGWILKNQKWYYLSPVSDNTQGMMCTGWQFIKGEWYYLNEDGDLATNTWIDNYYVNSEGVWVK